MTSIRALLILEISTIAILLAACATESPYSKLSNALRRGDMGTADSIVSKNSDINSCSALMLATEHNNLAAMKHFISGGTPNCYTSGTGVTVLMTAAENGHAEAAELLLASGAAVNTRSDKGWTASDYAAYREHFLVWDILKRHGGVGTLNAGQLAAAKAREAQRAQQERADAEQREAARCASARQQESQMCHPGNELACAAARAIAITQCG